MDQHEIARAIGFLTLILAGTCLMISIGLVNVARAVRNLRDELVSRCDKIEICEPEDW